MKQEPQTHKGDRVRIKDSVTHMYEKARIYNEAIVKATAVDDLGYPHIYVEWDKDHWAYSGEEDGWALEAHFDLVEENQKMEDKQEILKALEGLAKLIAGNGEGQDGPPEPEPQNVRDEREQHDELSYEQTLRNAFDAAKDGEAFIVLVASPSEFRGVELLAPQVFVNHKREDAALMLEAAMSDVAAAAHASLVLRLINEAKNNGPSSS